MQPTNSAEKELFKESQYLGKVQELLKKHRGSLHAAYEASADARKDGEDPALVKGRYAAETAVIDRVKANETSAILSGLAVGGMAFASVRFGPNYIISRLNPEKARLIREAERVSEEANTRWVQKTCAFLFEAAFGAWAGWRGYSIISSRNANSYEEIAKIPLCEGRSAISERVCPEWVNLVYGEIPPAFWRNLDDGEDCRLGDPNRWRAVRAFADNCVRRKVFEDSHRERNGLSPGTAVDVPKGGVPGDILLSLGKNDP